MFVAASVPFGVLVSSILAAALCMAALLAWYALGVRLRTKWSRRDKGVVMEPEKTPLHAKIEQMLLEARVILPGAQALLGFQLVVMMTRSFEQLPREVQVVHGIALFSLLLTVILLICPAAIHRIAAQGNDDPRIHSTGSFLITMALLPLAVAVSGDLWVALGVLFGENTVALAGATAAFALLLVLWFLLPLLIRRRQSTTDALTARE